MSKTFEERTADVTSVERDESANGHRRTNRRRDSSSALPDDGGAERLHAVEDDPAARRQLRVLVADEGSERLEVLAAVVGELGHEVVTRVAEHPEVALVGVGVSSTRALALIDEIAHGASCPVIALLPAQDSAYVHEAARRGIFAYIVDAGPEELQSAIDITLRRFTEYHDLQGAFGRRAVIEQAKGMLMARHGINADDAFALLRNHSQHGGGRLSDIAAAVVDTNALLPEAERRSASGDPI